MDVVEDILGSLRLTGGVVVDGRLTGEYCLAAQFTPEECAPFFPAPETLIGYHYIRSGRGIIHVEGQEPETLAEGDIAILPRNDAHLLASRIGLPPADPSEVSFVTEGGIHRISVGTGGPGMEMWCGVLGTAKANRHPILDALPPLLILRTRNGGREWLDSSLRFLAEDQPSREILARLAELILAQAIQDYVERLPPSASGWVRGLKDPAVAKALSIIHSRYAEELTIDELAREAGVSRTVLGERFAKMLGEPPMRYCGRWRMRVAANMLRDGRQNTANIAYAVGFNSEAAFNRAFKREFAEPPASWRRRVAEKERVSQADAAPGLPEQVVSYCASRDGTEIAYAACGDGFPLAKAATAVTHLQHDWSSPIYGHWTAELSRTAHLIRSDMRGFGMSERSHAHLTPDALVEDLAAVIDASGVEQCDLLGLMHGAATAILYAARYPQRVRKLVLLNSFAAGWAVRADPSEVAWRRSLMDLNRRRWARDRVALGEQFVSLYFPSAAIEVVKWHEERFDDLCSAQAIEALLELGARIDVRSELAKVKAPTLVFHCNRDGNAPLEVGREVAEGIAGAQFVELKSANHLLLGDEPAWRDFLRITRDFLGAPGGTGRISPPALHTRTEDQIRTCRGRDGAKLVYADSGKGFPVVKAPNWMTHLEHDWSSPVYGHWLRLCAEQGRLVRMDLRGFGMSDWDPPEFTFESMVCDLETVIDDAELDRCDLVGVSHGAAFAIAYAARHPDRVRKLVLVNSFAAGWRVRADPEEVVWRESLLEMNRTRPAFRRSLLGEMFITLYFPSASEELIAWHNELFDTLGPVRNMEPMIELVSRIDVRPELAKVMAPTLVCHGSKDGNAPLEVGRDVASGIAGARLVELDSANHVLLADEPAWRRFAREFRVFLRS